VGVADMAKSMGVNSTIKRRLRIRERLNRRRWHVSWWQTGSTGHMHTVKGVCTVEIKSWICNRKLQVYRQMFLLYKYHVIIYRVLLTRSICQNKVPSSITHFYHYAQILKQLTLLVPVQFTSLARRHRFYGHQKQAPVGRSKSMLATPVQKNVS